MKDVDIKAWDASYRVNLRRSVLLAHAFIPGMVARNWGVFVCSRWNKWRVALAANQACLAVVVYAENVNVKEAIQVKKSNLNWSADFPMQEKVEDYAGKMRNFVITCRETNLGYILRAEEQGSKGTGYQFTAYSETSPYNALSRLRQKMYRALAMRHITGSPGGYRMLHDKLRGRITSDGEGNVVLVVDGVPLSIDDFVSILECHEGWEFEMTIVDASD